MIIFNYYEIILIYRNGRDDLVACINGVERSHFDAN